MTAPTIDQFQDTIEGMNSENFTLLLELTHTARDLQDLAPDESTEFLPECSEAMTAHIDAGGTDPAGAVKPILARAKAQLSALVEP